MTYAELLAKLKKGEALTSEEVTEFEKVSRPAERFNEVSGQKQALEAKVKDLEGQLASKDAELAVAKQESEDTLTAKTRELAGMVETLTGENTELKNFKAMTERQAKVNKIGTVDCKEYVEATFADTEYLAVLLERRGVDLDKPEDVKAALTALKTEKPEQFLVDIKGGVPASGKGDAGGGTVVPEKTDFTKMQPEQKAAWIEKHGFEEYVKQTTGE